MGKKYKHPGLDADRITFKLWEVRNQLEINIELMQRDCPVSEMTQRAFGHPIEIATEHAFDRLNELEQLIHQKEPEIFQVILWDRDGKIQNTLIFKSLEKATDFVKKVKSPFSYPNVYESHCFFAVNVKNFLPMEYREHVNVPGYQKAFDHLIATIEKVEFSD